MVKPLKRVLKVKRNDNEDGFRIPTNSTKEALDSNHTQFIVLGDQDFNTKENKDETKLTKYDTQSKPTQCETLPVVLVLIERGLETIRTVLSVLAKNKHVNVIDGSGGAANFLSTCYRTDTRERNSERATLSDYNEDVEKLIDECYENDSEELEEEAQKLAKDCLQKLKLVNKQKKYLFGPN